jgi:hypothetical protein
MAMIVSNSGYIPPLIQTKSVDNGSTIAVTGNDLPIEKKSSEPVQIREAARLKMSEKTTGIINIHSGNGMYHFGLMALGQSTIEEWTSKGMNISDETVIAAGEALEQAMNKALTENGPTAGRSAALNKHQIVINSQDVPDWFIQEFENTLASMDNKEMKNAFEKGDLFFTSKPSSPGTNALASYASVANSI